MHSQLSSGPKFTIQTSTQPITVDPSKSALVIIDMQNFFLSEAFGRNKKGPGHAACEKLVEHAIPAARKAGIRVTWLNWGLTEEEVKNMPPAVKRAFGFFAIPADAEFKPSDDAFGHQDESVSVDRHGEENDSVYRGIGADCGTLTMPDGTTVSGGKLLMRDSWNAALYPPLNALYTEGAKLPTTPDVWIHKNRMSGMWGTTTPFKEFLDKEGIKTLFFTGVNTDQCVGGTLTDAFSNGYDCVLLSDGCGTTTPEYAQQCWEYNASRTFGFCASCKQFAEGISGA
jgi:nicotinamidase-related amidase